MPTFRVWSGLLVLAAASLTGDALCRRYATGGNREQSLAAAAKSVGALPASFGRWQMVESEPLAPETVAMLQCRGHESRVYAHDETGEKVTVVLLVGPAGPLVAHTPEICYSSVEFEVIQSARPEVLRGTGETADTFNRVIFQSNGLGGEFQAVYYGWRGGEGPWRAPQNPRLALGGKPFLYKLQVGSNVTKPAGGPGEAEAEETAAHRFVAELLPVLDQILASQ